jgi:hypothetical protein
MGLTGGGGWGKFRGMARAAKKKSASKQAAKKPAAGKKAKTPAPAVKAGARAAASGTATGTGATTKERSEDTTYTPKPIEGIGWPAFRYPPA